MNIKEGASLWDAALPPVPFSESHGQAVVDNELVLVFCIRFEDVDGKARYARDVHEQGPRHLVEAFVDAASCT